MFLRAVAAFLEAFFVDRLVLLDLAVYFLEVRRLLSFVVLDLRHAFHPYPRPDPLPGSKGTSSVARNESPQPRWFYLHHVKIPL